MISRAQRRKRFEKPLTQPAKRQRAIQCQDEAASEVATSTTTGQGKRLPHTNKRSANKPRRIVEFEEKDGLQAPWPKITITRAPTRRVTINRNPVLLESQKTRTTVDQKSAKHRTLNIARQNAKPGEKRRSPSREAFVRPVDDFAPNRQPPDAGSVHKKQRRTKLIIDRSLFV
jgi:hypothetical protein